LAVRAPLIAVALLALLPEGARAHVVASPTHNNRYLKITPAADRVRVAFTIMIGDLPGHAARQALDVDADGQVSDAEIEPWKQDLAERIRAQLTVRIDGVEQDVAWSELAIGLGMPDVSAGAFSLDLIAWFCAPAAGGRHELDLWDRFALTPPGETEVKIEDQPGITIDVARVGPEGGGGELISHEAKYAGHAAPVADGLRLVYTATTAPLADGRCPAAAQRSPSRTPRWPIALGALAAVVIAVVLTVRRRRPSG